MAPKRSIAWFPLLSATVLGAVLAGVVAWRLNLQSLEQRIKEERGLLKKLMLSGRVPPNQDVADYLRSRQSSLEQRYQYWADAVDARAMTDAAQADPQLYFQDRFHQTQRTLERLAAARKIAVPEQLGFPKEIPPPETVPRLLAQLTLIEESSQMILEQGVTVLPSLKIEDPESISEADAGEPLLLRAPVRVRFAGSLEQLMKVLGAVERARPFIDLRSLRVQPLLPSSSAEAEAKLPERLDVELSLARYLVVASAIESTSPQELSSSLPAAAREVAAPSGKTTRRSAKKGKARREKAENNRSAETQTSSPSPLQGSEK